MTRLELEQLLYDKILSKTEIGSISKSDVQECIIAVASYAEGFTTEVVNDRLLDVEELESNTRVAYVETNKPKQFFIKEAGEYTFFIDGDEIIAFEQTINVGDTCLINWDGAKAKSVILSSLAQDYNGKNKQVAISQFALNLLSQKVNNKADITRLDEYVYKDLSEIKEIKDLTGTDMFVRVYDQKAMEDKKIRLSLFNQDNAQLKTQELLGTKDEKNQTFTCRNPYMLGTSRVYVNGVRYFKDISYKEVDDTTITFGTYAPKSDDVLMIESILSL